MLRSRPPAAGLTRAARTGTLAAGTTAWRVHTTRYVANQMNPTPQPTVDRGGRFDSYDGSYAYLYIADSPEAAIAETLCRDLPLEPFQNRIVPNRTVSGRVLTQLTVTEGIVVAALHGPAVSAIGQGLWLTKCDAADYYLTRQWAAAVFAADPAARGLAYRPRHDEDRMAWMLATDPTTTIHPALAVEGASLPLDRGLGKELVAQVLAAHSATLSHLP